MSAGKDKAELAVGDLPEVFDRTHLARYSMGDDAFEREIISLFLTQLVTTMNMIEQAGTAAEWKLWTHTLKGAAAAVGAKQLQSLALDLEAQTFDSDPLARLGRLRALDAAVQNFRVRIADIFPQLAA